MSPTIVLDHDKVYMGTVMPCGATVISTVMQSIVNVVAFGMNMQQAVDAPRMHMQWLPDLIAVEPGLLTPDAQAKLEAMGHKIREMKSWGADEAILVDSDGEIGRAHV